MRRVRLMYSANEGDIEGIKEILECGTDVNFRDIDKRTALHVAACHGSSDVVQLLLDNGAEVDPKDRWGSTKVQLTEADTKTEQKVKFTEAETKTDVYSVWGLPSEEVSNRVKKLMNGLRSEFGGPQFEPHVTVVGAIKLSEEEARDKFRKGCGEVKKLYSGTVEKFDVGFVYLLLHPTTEVMEASARCCSSFGYNSASPYMPHMSLLYADLTDEEKKKAQEKAYILDESIGNMSFQITRPALYKTDPEDKSLKSWEKIEEYNLSTN